MTTNIGFHVIPDSEAALDGTSLLIIPTSSPCPSLPTPSLLTPSSPRPESIRILSPGGTLAFTTWTAPLGWAPDVQAAFASLPFPAPFTASTQMTPWGSWSDPNWIRKTLQHKGLQDVKVEPYAFLQRVDSAEYFVRNFWMIINWVMTSCWSEELRREHPREEVEGLVRGFLEEMYKDQGGSWDLTWVAVVASGRVAE